MSSRTLRQQARWAKLEQKIRLPSDRKASSDRKRPREERDQQSEQKIRLPSDRKASSDRKRPREERDQQSDINQQPTKKRRAVDKNRLKKKNATFEVQVQTLSSQTLLVTLHKNQAVKTLKKIIQKKQGTHVSLQEVYLLPEIDDDDSTEQNALKNGFTFDGPCTVVLCIKLETEIARLKRECKERKKVLVKRRADVIAGNCQNGEGTFRYKTGATYEGQWQDGQKHGTGTHLYEEGDTYEGQFQDSKRHGTGTYIYADGGKYEGEWQHGRKHGAATFSSRNGSKYDGQYEDGRMNGSGTNVYANGSSYTGQFSHGKKNGAGIYSQSDGYTYDGQWQHGKKHGTGALVYGTGGSKKISGWEWVQPGDRYDGTFVQDQHDGIGWWTHAENGKVERIECRHDAIVGWPDRKSAA